LDAVTGLTTHWSSGLVEGHVNHIKMVKRQMFGRAGLPLLRKRVLLTATRRCPWVSRRVSLRGPTWRVTTTDPRTTPGLDPRPQ
jgi:hypothetical protein